MELRGDKALEDITGDRLGFAATAEAIATALLRQSAVDGLVLGIEGRWGSGKSTLANMAVASLRAGRDGKAPEIVEFKPWLIGDRDGLLLALFTELAMAVDAIEESEGDPVSGQKRKLGDGGKKILGFAVHLGGLGALVKILGNVVPGAALAGEAMEAAARAAKDLDVSRSLAAEKAELRKRLASLPRRIIVTIDDVDRLEPSEVVEILRLVRSVADFPNLIYVLCYDPSIVAHSIEAAAKVENGRAYIEKIVQIAVSVPRPEAFDLRRWFGDEINALPHNSDEAGAWSSRLSSVIDVEGGRYLSTPRHVARSLDSIRFFWGALQDQVDLSDLVWLNLVKTGNPKLYNWIEQYLTETVALSSGLASISEEEKWEARKNLEEALLAEGLNFESACHRLSSFLPGIYDGFDFRKKDDPGVHGHFSNRHSQISSKLKRLSSPDHYRLYFAIQQPRNSPTPIDFESLFIALNNSVLETADLFIRWSRDLLSTGATKAEVILSRIAVFDGEVFEPKRAKILLSALADISDEVANVRDPGFGAPQFWIEANRVLRWLLPNLGQHRQETVLCMFRGRALEWLTRILRSELLPESWTGSRVF